MDKITRQEVVSLFPSRDPRAYKGVFGRVLVVAGSRQMCGAGLLCAKGALRVGAGLVYWALPASMQPTFAAAFPEVITIPLPENERGEIAETAWPILTDFIEKQHPTLAVVGMGMQESPLLPTLLQEIPLPPYFTSGPTGRSDGRSLRTERARYGGGYFRSGETQFLAKSDGRPGTC